MRLAVIIPALNEEATIAEVVATVSTYGEPFVVSDGSTDATAARARDAGAVVVEHSENRGYDGALATGLRTAFDSGIEVAVTYDADGQFEPGCLAEICLAMTDPDVAIAIGERPERARWVERVFGWMTTARYGVPDPFCGVKAYRADWYRRFAEICGRRTVNTGLALAVLRAGGKAAIVPVTVRPRADRSRFGGGLRGNAKLLRAVLEASK